VLKSSSHTSRGYNSLVFVSKKSAPLTRKAPQKASSHSCCVVAGDAVGAIRMWDVTFPNRPIWSISMGPYPVNSIVLSHSKREIICGSQSGVIAVRMLDAECLEVTPMHDEPNSLDAIADLRRP
jgi:WD40 repeat protein